MKKSILFLLLAVNCLAYSQTLTPEGIFCATGNLKSPDAQISWTLGDMLALSNAEENPNDFLLTQGFIQSDLTITSVQNIADSKGLELFVYPNPVKDILNIRLDSKNNTSINIQLFDLYGKLVYSKTISSMENEKTLNFQGLRNGMYLLKASATDKTFAKTYKILFED